MHLSFQLLGSVSRSIVVHRGSGIKRRHYPKIMKAERAEGVA
jgi:hypothetical protein